MLANTYAQLISTASKEADVNTFLKKLFIFMKSRGHLSLLSQVVRILERAEGSDTKAVVSVRSAEDAKKYSDSIAETLKTLQGEHSYKIVEDPRVVGGFSVRSGSQMIDKTFRKALISIYQKTIHQ